jgi:type VI secretion system protein ImpL
MWEAVRDLLFRLTPYMPALVGGLIVLALISIAGLVLVMRKSRGKGADADEEEGAPPRRADADPDYEPFAQDPGDIPLLPMRKSFQHALRLLKTHVSGRDWRYAIPWYLLLGPEQSGKSALAASTGMDLPVGQPAEDFEDLRPACKWWFFDRGVVLDVAGGLIRQRDGRASNLKAWSRFLGLLDDKRPRRPADGIILTIPIEDLLDDEGMVRPPEDIAQRADAVYKKLWQAQARLGLAFPVYAVVTKGDRLPGFRALVDSLPEQALADMLGWASPYSFETEFHEEWVDEAVDDIGAALQEAQMSIFATARNPDVAEDVYELPASFEGLREPLRIYMRQLFKASTYHESFSLRGIWLTGDSGLEMSADRASIPVLSGVYGGPRTRRAVPVFLRDLFEIKIFPERHLARPVKRALLSRNKTATFAQAASAAVAVLGGLYLWYMSGALSHDVTTVTPFVEEVRGDMADVSAGGQSGFNRERALSLLEGMAAQETGSFFSLLIPTSWVADVDDRVVDLTTDAFNLFILQTMSAALDERGRAIAAGRLPPEGESRAASLLGDDRFDPDAAPSVERGPHFEALRRYVGAVRDFEDAVGRYNGLGETESLEDIRRLVAYLFNVELPETFLENSDFYDEALGGAAYRTVPLDSFRRDMRERYVGYERAAMAALYADNPVIADLRGLAAALDGAANSRTAGAPELNALYEAMLSLEAKLDDPIHAWMDDPTFDPTIAYSGLSERIGGSRILGPEIAESFSAAHQTGLAALRTELPDIRAVSIGPVLDREEDAVVLRLTPTLTELESVLVAMAGRAFMATDRPRPLPASATVGAGVEWDLRPLEEGIDLIADHDGFLADQLDRVPRAMRSLVSTAAARMLERAVNDRIAAAVVIPRGRGGVGIRSEESLRRAVASFSEAGTALLTIQAVYDELGLEDSYLDLQDLTVSSAFTLLERADALFSAEPLYVPRGGDFSWWDGGPGLALDAFRARDPFELRDVLARQRGRIGIIGNDYVAPLATLLDQVNVRLSDREAALLGKWRRIIDETTKYDLQQADNTVAELERFITGPLLDVTFANCGEVMAETAGRGRGGDFFLNRISLLSRNVRSRCLSLAGVEAQSAYSAVADAFEDLLAGRYPFTLTPFETDMREITPRELRAFFTVYDREAGNARQALEQADTLGFERDQALAFLTRMDSVRALFDPWLSSPNAGDSPVFDLTVSFRVNRAREIGADQVIDWRLSSGPDVASLRGGGENTLRWALGEPILVTLRWAENSTVVPAASVDRGPARVRDRTAEIAYDNVWSLIDLIRRHRSGSDDFVEFVDPRPHTLRFELPTRPAAGGTIEQARLFIRVEVSAQLEGQPVPLVVNPFPYEVPRLSP